MEVEFNNNSKILKGSDVENFRFLFLFKSYLKMEFIINSTFATDTVFKIVKLNFYYMCSIELKPRLFDASNTCRYRDIFKFQIRHIWESF